MRFCCFCIILSLTGNQIGSKGFKVISEALKVNSTLAKLNICGNEGGERERELREIKEC